MRSLRKFCNVALFAALFGTPESASFIEFPVTTTAMATVH